MLHCWKKINKNVSVGTPKRHVWCVGNFVNFGYGEKMSYQLSFVFNLSHIFPGSTLLSSKAGRRFVNFCITILIEPRWSWLCCSEGCD